MLPDISLGGNNKNTGLQQFQYANNQANQGNPFNILSDHLIVQNNSFSNNNLIPQQVHGSSFSNPPYQIKLVQQNSSI
jgi:hypothetical protein